MTSLHGLTAWFVHMFSANLYPSESDQWQKSFYGHVILPARNGSPDDRIETLRLRNLRDFTPLTGKDFGSGSRIKNRTVSKIAAYGISKTRISLLLKNIIEEFKLKTVVELGTSLGINTLYLAKAANVQKVFTFESDPLLASLAQSFFNETGNSNIKLIVGNIDDTLPVFTRNCEDIDFVFFDANHTFLATMNYFEILIQKRTDLSVFVFDDIYRSGCMTKAWNTIRKNKDVTLSINLYRMGIIFFNPTLPKHTIRFKL